MSQRKWTVKIVNWHDLVFTSLFLLKMNQKPSSKKMFPFPSNISKYQMVTGRVTYSHFTKTSMLLHDNYPAILKTHIWQYKIAKICGFFSEWEKQRRENSLFCQANTCLLVCFICWSTETLSHHVSVFRDSNLAELIISDDWARLLWPGQLSQKWMFI